MIIFRFFHSVYVSTENSLKRNSSINYLVSLEYKEAKITSFSFIYQFYSNGPEPKQPPKVSHIFVLCKVFSSLQSFIMPSLSHIWPLGGPFQVGFCVLLVMIASLFFPGISCSSVILCISFLGLGIKGYLSFVEN